MTELFILRGLPGVGKSTLARQYVQGLEHIRARVNRDDLRRMLHNGRHLGVDTETQIVLVRNRLVADLLQAGISVVVDETMLEDAAMKRFINIMRGHCSAKGRPPLEVRIEDLRTVPLERVHRQNNMRLGKGGFISPDVIDGMYDKWIKPYLQDDGSIREQTIEDLLV